MSTSTPNPNQQNSTVDYTLQLALSQANTQHQQQMFEMEKKLLQLEAAMEGKVKDVKIAALEARLVDQEKFHLKELSWQKQLIEATIPKVSSPPTYTIDSVILDAVTRQSIFGWYPGNWSLLFRASRDGSAAATFHSRCNNQGQTLVIVRVGTYVFGGFASESWKSTNAYVNVPGCSLFVLVNAHGSLPTLIPCTSNSHAMYDSQSYGPTFGAGFSLHLSDSCTNNSSSYCALISTHYADFLALGQNTFVGSRNFQVSDYEVFRRA
jgi:hypothetical protein